MSSRITYRYPRCICNSSTRGWGLNSSICLACGRGLRGTGELVTRIPCRHVLVPRAARRRTGLVPCHRNPISTITVNSGHLVNNPQCPICLCQYQLGTVARELPCSHIYHSNCIVPWLARSPTCPLCRCSLPRGQTNSPSARGGAYNYVHQYIPGLILLLELWIIFAIPFTILGAGNIPVQISDHFNPEKQHLQNN